MITDRLNNAEQYYTLGEKIKLGFEFLKNNDLKTMPDGKYEISGNKIYANVQTLTTKNKDLKKWEAHRKYIDIQYVITGEECMGYGILEDFKTIVQHYSEANDIEFLNGSKYNFINVKAGDFVIFYPNDVHAPMLSVNNDKEIKKVIVKIEI